MLPTPGMRNPWAQEYGRTPDHYIWGKVPSRFAQEISLLVPRGGRVLDLGCGEGRDSVFFARRGYDVTGLDISPEGLDKARRLAAEHGVSVRWLCLGMAELPAIGRFDLVYSCGAVHHVPRAERAHLFRRLGTLSRPGAIHAHVVFTDVSVYVERGEEIDYFAPGELRGLYGHEYTVLEDAPGFIPCRQDGVQHVHSVGRLVARLARRPSRTPPRSRVARTMPRAAPHPGLTEQPA